MYLVCDSLGNIMARYYNKESAICHKKTFGNNHWKIVWKYLY